MQTIFANLVEPASVDYTTKETGLWCSLWVVATLPTSPTWLILMYKGQLLSRCHWDDWFPLLCYHCHDTYWRANEIFHISELQQHVKSFKSAVTSVMKTRRNIFALV